MPKNCATCSGVARLERVSSLVVIVLFCMISSTDCDLLKPLISADIQYSTCTLRYLQLVLLKSLQGPWDHRKMVANYVVNFVASKSGPLAEVRPFGPRVPIPATVRFDDIAGCDVELRLDLEESGRLVPRAVSIEAREGSPAVTGTTLRELKVSELVRAAGRYLQGAEDYLTDFGTKPEDLGTMPPQTIPILSPDETTALNEDLFLRTILSEGDELRAKQSFIDKLRKAGPSSEKTGNAIAHLYRLAERQGRPPNRFIEQLLALSPATASHWVKLARRNGYLEPSTRRTRS